MKYYVRKIRPAKWLPLKNAVAAEFEDCRSEAICNDIRTINDKLSLWKIDSMSPEGIEPVAVINSLLGENIQKIELLFIPEKCLIDFKLEQSDGETIVENYKKAHYDIVNLTVKKHGLLAEIVWPAVKGCISKKNEWKAWRSWQGKGEKGDGNESVQIIHFRPTDQVDLIKKWIDRHEFKFDDLKEGQKKDLSKK